MNFFGTETKRNSTGSCLQEESCVEKHNSNLQHKYRIKFATGDALKFVSFVLDPVNLDVPRL